MSRDVEIIPVQDADLTGTLLLILLELKKMNMYLALMNDTQLDDEDVEE